MDRAAFRENLSARRKALGLTDPDTNIKVPSSGAAYMAGFMGSQCL
jgi:hypothetical protein